MLCVGKKANPSRILELVYFTRDSNGILLNVKCVTVTQGLFGRIGPLRPLRFLDR